jgi:uncharacterized protein (TIGR00369 family)
MAGMPEGFEPHYRKSGLTDPWEPLYSRRTDEAVILGLLAAEPHANSRGFVHGGLIAALADNAMGLSCGVHLENATGLVTVGMSIDYLATARLGQWLEFTTNFVKAGRSLAFAQMLVTADGAPVARANATFSVQRREA